MTKASPTKKLARRKSSSAADTYRGFSLQATRFLLRLLEADIGETVCLEVFDDVGIQHLDGSRTAEQDKSNVVSNPISNRSVEFWKTFRNWIEASQRGELDPNRTRFILYASHPTHGEIAKSFSEKSSVKEATAAIEAAKVALGGNIAHLPDSLRPHVEVFFQTEQMLVSSIVARFSLEIGAGNPHEEVRAAFLKELVSEDAVDDVLRWAHGWVKTEVDQLHNDRKPAFIHKSEFHKAALNYVRTHDRVTILRSVAGKPTDAEIQGEIAFRDYVRQLQLIDVNDEDVLEAVNDFLRASIDRTKWADQGWIDESSLVDFADKLERTWKNYRDKTFIGHSDKPLPQQGKLLLRECLGHELKLDRLEVPTHFTCGSWHTLAEDRTIGWHPQYLERLDQETPASQTGEATK